MAKVETDFNHNALKSLIWKQYIDDILVQSGMSEKSLP